MRSWSTELKVGVFAALMLALLAYSTIKVSDRSIISTGSYELSVVLNNVTGLKMKAPVELAGVPVGAIKRIELLETGKARVIILVDKGVKLPLDSKAVLRTRGFLGETYVELIPGSPGKGFIQDGSEVESMGHTGDMNSLINSMNLIAKDIKTVTGSLAEVQEGKEGAPIDRIVANLEEFTRSIRDLTVSNQDNIDSLATNMAVVASEMRAMVVQSRKDIETSLAAIASVAGKIDRGEGTVGRLINDDETIEKLNEVADNLNETLGGIKKFETEFGYHAEFLTKSQDFKHYVSLDFKPSPDKAFMLDIISDPAPRPTHVQRTTDVTVGGNTTEVVTDTATVNRDKIKISAQLAKKFYDFTIRGGMIESSGGMGVDYTRGPIGASFEAFDFSTRFNERPHLKAYASLNVTKNFFVLGGADDFINRNQSVDWFVGAGFRLVDDDIKSLVGLGSLAR